MTGTSVCTPVMPEGEAGKGLRHTSTGKLVYYVGATIEVDLRTATNVGVSVGLQIDPITLSPLEVVGGAPEPYGRSQPLEASTTGRNVYLERLRQQRYLVSDTRELTHADVIAAVTLRRHVHRTGIVRFIDARRDVVEPVGPGSPDLRQAARPVLEELDRTAPGLGTLVRRTAASFTAETG